MSTPPPSLKCGLVMPISAMGDYSEAHWQDVAALIKEALADTQFKVELVSDSNEIGVIQKRIVQNLYDSDIVICDVSAKNPNVMFELGMRLAFDKPAIIIKDSSTSYSFDTAPIEHLTYPRDLQYHSIQTFKQTLKEKTVATYNASLRPEYTTFLKHFGEFVVASIEAKPVGKEEFILRELNDLRSELRDFARASRARVEWVSALSLPNEARTPRIISEAEFVKSFLAKSKVKAKDLGRLDSESFRKLTIDYLTAAGLNALMLSESDQESIRRKLLGALNAAA